jgi:MFS family permease
MMSAFGASAFVGRLGLGAVADRVGARRTLIASMALQAIVVSLLGMLAGPWALAGLAVVFGIAYGGVFAQFPVLIREYFGATQMGAVYGAQGFMGAVGMAVGPYLAGLIHDITGTYRVPFWLSGGVAATSMFLAYALHRPSLPEAAGGRGAIPATPEPA